MPQALEETGKTMHEMTQASEEMVATFNEALINSDIPDLEAKLIGVDEVRACLLVRDRELSFKLLVRA